ncbi:XrtA system polysaccharide deacetylase [Paracraurococcus lichenis]|uniref:Chitooligosaccharide deacetylase n=1 Tax=Paracraurococcus lichenis TaxID=3064888 RepID=A0ABT9E6E0_9PROT|nr:XrtA system polysaccharide deacetylase [Paracraurococcus sp. LOR1-02]MDO9711739.1 DUF3473 domain-containing protein [Paracraurococcus sp. LOR1-02]
MSVDVEDWFQVQAYHGLVPRRDWESLDRRVERNTDRLLEMFDRAGVKATFFTLGWVAKRHPALVRRIVAGGHELASHGYGHQRVFWIGKAAFRMDIRCARRLLEDVAGVPVRGYRAPTFSIDPQRTPWAHAVLAEEGYAYSSSVFPAREVLSGGGSAPRGPHRPDPNGVLELPMTAVRILGRDLPCSGGNWFRQFPYRLFRAGLLRVNRAEQRPGIFYIHPWEIDPDQPRLPQAGLLTQLRHHNGLRSMERRLERLLRDFRWDRMDRVFPEATGGTAPHPVTA